MDAACLKLYLATDPDLIAGRDLVDLVAQAVAAGVTLVQLRDKQAAGLRLYETACRLRAVTRRLGVPLIINDRVDIMLAAAADGVHVGATDLPLAQVRALAPGRLVGYPVTEMADVEIARRDGADYIGIGPVFPTSTKPDASAALGLAGLRRLAASANLPCVAIGGITPANCAAVLEAGADGVCAISAILGQTDIAAAVQRFRAALDAAAVPCPRSAGGTA
jgi:thiamine-phosphate pyrophosphorylase